MRLPIFLFGLVVGLVPGTLVYFVGLDVLVANVMDQLVTAIVGVLSISVILIIVFIFRDRISAYFFGTVRGNLQKTASHAVETIYAITSGNGRTAADEARNLGEELLAWWIWTNGIRSAFRAIFALVAVFAACLGTFLLFRQNEIMRDQIDLSIRQQEFLATQDYENRLLSIVDIVAAEGSVSVSAKTRITRLFAESDTLVHKATSAPSSSSALCRNPGQFLEKRTRIVRLLLEAGAHPDELGLTSLENIDLSNMELSGLSFRGLDVNGADFSQSNLSGTDFKNLGSISANFFGATLDDAEFDDTQISNSCFEQVRARRVSFYSSGISESSFREANLDGADFQERGIKDVDFSGASLVNAYFDHQNIENVVFKGAFMPFVTFGGNDDEVTLIDVDFSDANIAAVNFYWVDEADRASINTIGSACISQDWQPCGSNGRYIELPACKGELGQGVNYTNLGSRGRDKNANNFPRWETHTHQCAG